ncbi:MAG: hypothetical protein DYH13_09045 [Alphaproteobacteria bacterium PRO2]|nr:hypothetical protein [Alphaproteobacteria bacterium PRO2]
MKLREAISPKLEKIAGMKREIAGALLGVFLTAAGTQIYNAMSPPPHVPSSGLSGAACREFDQRSAVHVQEIAKQVNRSILGGYETLEKNGYYKAIIPDNREPLVIDVHHMSASLTVSISQHYDKMFELLDCKQEATESSIAAMRKHSDDYTRRVIENQEKKKDVKRPELPYIPEFPELHNPYEGRTLRINYSPVQQIPRFQL